MNEEIGELGNGEGKGTRIRRIVRRGERGEGTATESGAVPVSSAKCPRCFPSFYIGWVASVFLLAETDEEIESSKNEWTGKLKSQTDERLTSSEVAGRLEIRRRKSEARSSASVSF